MPEGEAVDLDEIVAPAQFFLDLFDDTPKTGKWVINEVLQWYSHAADEVNSFIVRGDEHTVRDYQEFLRLFGFEIEGVDYEADVDPDVKISNLIQL